MNNFVKLVNKVLRKIFNIELIRAERLVRQRMYDGLIYLRDSKGFQPNVCIDVGVAEGTPDLYRAFPNATHMLIEPLSEYERHITNLSKKYNIIYEKCAASSISGEMEILIPDRKSGSSFFDQQDTSKSVNRRLIITKTLDELFIKHSIKGSVLLKVDAEGAELEVLKGAKAILEKIDVVILEATFIPKLVGAPDFTLLIEEMKQIDFVIFDWFDVRVRPDGALFQADLVFVRTDSHWRK